MDLVQYREHHLRRHGKLGFGPLNFSNYRDGGYAELAYRPTLSSNKVMRDLEFIFRYDLVRTPTQSPGGEHEQSYEFGVDYWLTPSWVLKVAYAVDHRKVPRAKCVFCAARIRDVIEGKEDHHVR